MSSNLIKSTMGGLERPLAQGGGGHCRYQFVLLWAGSGAEGVLGSDFNQSLTAGHAVPAVLDNIWYAVLLRVSRALAPIPPPLEDILALSLSAHTMGEKLLKGQDIKRVPNGQ